MIRITLSGAPGALTGTLQINDAHWLLSSWRKQTGGEVHATTSEGHRVTLATDNGRGGITVNGAPWDLDGCKWSGLVMTGEATEPPPDDELRALFPGVFA